MRTIGQWIAWALVVSSSAAVGVENSPGPEEIEQLARTLTEISRGNLEESASILTTILIAVPNKSF